MPRPRTVFLLPGGGGGFGQVEDGKATSNNFLVRSEAFFVANGFNVAIFGRPNASQDLDYADRISEAHLIDIRKVLAFVKQKGQCACLDCRHQPGCGIGHRSPGRIW